MKLFFIVAFFHNTKVEIDWIDSKDIGDIKM